MTCAVSAVACVCLTIGTVAMARDGRNAQRGARQFDPGRVLRRWNMAPIGLGSVARGQKPYAAAVQDGAVMSVRLKRVPVDNLVANRM